MPLLRATALVATSAIALMACASSVETGTVAGRAGGRPATDARVVEVEARNFSFDPDTIRVRRGEEIALTLRSSDGSHDFAVEGLGRVADVSGGETATQRLRIDEVGKFSFHCTIPGHRAGGMEGTITVR
jgi:plastocyanin